MDAVVSGHAGVALLLDGDRLSSIHFGEDGVVLRSPSEVSLLFSGAGDLQLLRDVKPEQVRERLDLESTRVDALHLALILLDSELSEETRQTAAEELEEELRSHDSTEDEASHEQAPSQVDPAYKEGGIGQMDVGASPPPVSEQPPRAWPRTSNSFGTFRGMADGGITSWLEGVLFAHPLPASADLTGAYAACTDATERTWALLRRLESLQPVVKEVHEAWQVISSEWFRWEKDRQYALAVLVKAGFFRELVLKSTLDLDDLRSQIKTMCAAVTNSLRESEGEWEAVEKHEAHARLELESAYVAPRNDLEESIAAIWQEILGVEPVGVHDNFFELGGHSLLGTQVIARLRGEFDLDSLDMSIFEHPTVSGFAAVLQGEKAKQGDQGIEASRSRAAMRLERMRKRRTPRY